MILVEYIQSRLKPLQFFVLAIFLSFLLVDQDYDFGGWWQAVLFLFISFLVFRFLDDSGSVRYDRIHYPERTYLTKEHFLKFFLITIVILIIYLIVNLIINQHLFYILLSLVSISVIAYFLFGNNNQILALVPLIKYPVLLFCLAKLDMNWNLISVCTSSFFIMFIYDRLDTNLRLNKDKWIIIGATFICGLLIFLPWNNAIAYFFILLAVFASFFLYKWKHFKFFSIVYYPILLLIQSLI